MNQPAARFRLSDLTSAAFAAVAPGNPVILLPLGSHEDHGPHLPMGDYLLADALAARIAEMASARGTPAFVAPTLPFGAADHFGASPGGLAIAPDSFRAILADLLAGLLRHGLTRILILNGHGGNVPLIHEVTLAIKRTENIIIPSFYLWKIARKLMETRLGPGHAQRFGHGAEPLLSLSLARRPAECSPAAAEPWQTVPCLGLPVTDFGTVAFDGAPIDVPVEFDQVPRNATEAALPRASAVLGQAVADELVETGAKFVIHFARVASESGLSKSRNTPPAATGPTTTPSK